MDIKTWYFKNQAIMERLELVKAFADRPHFGLYGGEGWKKYGLPVQGWVNEYALAKIYNQSKIVLASDAYIDIPGFTSNRTTKVLLSGSFLLIRRFAGIEEIFKNRHHLVWFDTVDEAIELADYYLEHEDERNNIALNGLSFAQQNMDLLPNIAKWIGIAKANRNKVIYIGTEWKYRTWWLGYHLRRIIFRMGGETGLLTPKWFRTI